MSQTGLGSGAVVGGKGASPQSSSSSQSGTSLKEHDLLGLSEVSSSSSVARQENSSPQNSSSFLSDGLNLNLNLGATELRLGPKDASNGTGATPMPEQASEASHFLGGHPERTALVAADRRSSNIDLYGGGLEGSSSACRPLIESESLRKLRSGGVERKVSNESLKLGMSLTQPKRGLNQEDVGEKQQQLFLNPERHNFQDNAPEVKQYQDRSWQHGQDDVSSGERVVSQVSDRVAGMDHQQGVGKQGSEQQHERITREAFQIEKRNFSESNALGALQKPEPRFGQDLGLPERTPRHQDYPQQKQLWQSHQQQQLVRSSEVSRQTPEFQTQQQQTCLNAQQEERNGFHSFPGSRVMYGPSKPGVSGAKRPFDTIGTSSDARSFNDGRSGLPSPVSANSSVITGNTSSSDAEAKSKGQAPPLYQSWGAGVAKATPSWQMLQHSGGSFGPFPSQTPSRSNPSAEVAGGSSGVDAAAAAQKAWEAHTGKGIQQDSKQQATTSLGQKMGPSENNNNKPGPPAQSSASAAEGASPPSRAAAPPAAVGWPPLRSFRKSTIASQLRPSPVETQPPRPPPPAATQAVSPPSVASSVASQPLQHNLFFVKVYMDGVAIGRKVDLKANSSYEKLSLVLEDMFRGFANGQQAGKGARDMVPLPSDKRSFLHGSDYVLTYEDQDGDLMLVGDVPWTMFMDTVKRLRIMKGSEAIGLGTRAAEKVNRAQPAV